MQTENRINQRRLTPRQLADRLSTSKATVMSWHHAGIIPAVVAVGRIYRFDINEVEAALAEHRNRKAGLK
jgi:excisionase family DNA binding protein